MVVALEVILTLLAWIPAELVETAAEFVAAVPARALRLDILAAIRALRSGRFVLLTAVLMALLLALMPAARVSKNAGLVEAMAMVLISLESIKSASSVRIALDALAAIPAVLVAILLLLSAMEALIVETIIASYAESIPLPLGNPLAIAREVALMLIMLAAILFVLAEMAG